MTELLTDALSNHLGLHLLHWAISQSDIWYLAHRCADFVNKIHEPLERGAAVLDHILTLEEEEADLNSLSQNNEHRHYWMAGDMNQQIPIDYINGDRRDGKC